MFSCIMLLYFNHATFGVQNECKALLWKAGAQAATWTTPKFKNTA